MARTRTTWSSPRWLLARRPRRGAGGTTEHQPLDLRLPAEVEQQPNAASGCFEIVEQLRNGIRLDTGRRLDLDQHDTIDKEVGVESSDHLAVEMHVERHFLDRAESGCPNDDPQGAPVDRFREPVPELAVDL